MSKKSSFFKEGFSMAAVEKFSAQWWRQARRKAKRMDDPKLKNPEKWGHMIRHCLECGTPVDNRPGRVQVEVCQACQRRSHWRRVAVLHIRTTIELDELTFGAEYERMQKIVAILAERLMVIFERRIPHRDEFPLRLSPADASEFAAIVRLCLNGN